MRRRKRSLLHFLNAFLETMYFFSRKKIPYRMCTTKTQILNFFLFMELNWPLRRIVFQGKNSDEDGHI